MVFKGKEIFIDTEYKYLLREYSVYFSKTGYLQFTVSDRNGLYKGSLLHRVIWLKEYDKFSSNKFVHHKNGNKLDNRASNLMGMSHSEHTKLHNKGHTKWLGRTHSEETKQKIREWNLGRTLSQETKDKISQARKDGLAK